MKHVGILLVVMGILLYGLAHPWNPTGYADADELLVTSLLGSIPHPPGYLGWTYITHSISGLAPQEWQPSAVYWLQIIIAAGVLGIVFIVIYRLLELTLKINKSDALLISALTALLMGSSFLYWLYASTTEIFHSALFLLMSVIWLLLQANRTGRSRWYFFSAVLFGVYLAHYQLGLLVTPFYGLAWLLSLNHGKNIKNWIQSGFVGVLLVGVGLLAYIGPWYWLLDNTVPLSWISKTSNQSVMTHLLRADYGQPKWRRELTVPAYVRFDHITKDSFWWGFTYALRLGEMAGWPLTLLAAAGLGYLFKHKRKEFWLLGGVFITTGPLLAVYMFHPSSMSNYLQQGVESRQFLMNIGVTTLLAGYGLVASRQWMGRKMVLILTLIAISLQLWSNRSLLFDKSPRKIVAQYAQQILTEVPEHSLIICATDIDCYSLFYQRDIEGLRSDVEVIPFLATYRVDYLRQRPDLYPFNLFAEPEFLGLLLGYNIHQRPVILTQGFERYMEYYSLEKGLYYLEPKGLYIRVLTEKPETAEKITPSTYTFAEAVPKGDSRDWYYRGIRSYFANIWLYQSYLSLLNGQEKLAEDYFGLAEIVGEDNEQLPLIRQLLVTDRVTEPVKAMKIEDFEVNGEHFTATGDWEGAEHVWRLLAFYKLKNQDYWEKLRSALDKQNKQMEMQRIEIIQNDLAKLGWD